MTNYQECMEDWQAEAYASGTTTISFFLGYACEQLDAQQGYELASFQEATHITRSTAGNLIRHVDGYCFDRANPNNLTLILCDFDNSETQSRLTKTNIADLFKRLERFYKDCRKGVYSSIPAGLPTHELVNIISKKDNNSFNPEGGTLNLHLITNRQAATEYTTSKIEVLPSGKELSINYRVSDFNDICDAKPQPIVFDFTTLKKARAFPEGIPYLKAAMSEGVDFYESYLLVMPAEALAECYNQYETRILEQNVRVYLQKKGKVNAGIHKTIEEEPYAFFIYNNGLAITAEDIDFNEDGTRILRIHGLQIVNGGQTTACLHEAFRNRVDISGVSVQVKLTKVSHSIARVIVPYISKFSNSQNAVKDSDLMSNDIVQRSIEKHSRSIKTPTGIPTTWYYERVRGQYANALLHKGARERKDFEARNPKKQVVKAQKFAQAIMMFELCPYLVAQGEQKTFVGTGSYPGFCEIMSAVQNANPGLITKAEWYKENMGKYIFFQNGRDEIKKYLNASRNQLSKYGLSVSVYSMALFLFILKQLGKSLDCNKIWEYQKLDEGLIDLLYRMTDYLTSQLSGRLDTQEWLKQIRTWDKLSQQAFMDYEKGKLVLDFSKSKLISEQMFVTFTEIGAVKEKNANLTGSQDLVMRVYPDVYWECLRAWVETNGHKLTQPLDAKSALTAIERRLAQKKVRQIQCTKLLEYIRAAKSIGWNEPFNPQVQVDRSFIKTTVNIESGDVLQTFIESNRFDVLVLTRTCDLSGGCKLIKALMSKYLNIEVEESLIPEEARELGSVHAFKVERNKYIVLAYTRKTNTSVHFEPILEVCLRRIANDYQGKSILMPYLLGEDEAISSVSKRKRFENLVRQELYSHDVVIMRES